MHCTTLNSKRILILISLRGFLFIKLLTLSLSGIKAWNFVTTGGYFFQRASRHHGSTVTRNFICRITPWLHPHRRLPLATPSVAARYRHVQNIRIRSLLPLYQRCPHTTMASEYGDSPCSPDVVEGRH